MLFPIVYDLGAYLTSDTTGIYRRFPKKNRPINGCNYHRGSSIPLAVVAADLCVAELWWMGRPRVSSR